MRRQWMLAETPVVSTLELQDTLPPNKRPSSAPPDPSVSPPRPLFSAPRVSSTAATRRLRRVVPRDDRALTVAATVVGLTIAALLLGFLWKSRASKAESASPPAQIAEVDSPLQGTEVDTPPLEAVPADRREVSGPSPSAATPTAQASANSAVGAVPSPILPTKTPHPRADQGPNVPQSAAPASGKIPPAQKARPESDIKSPLFGK
jgi:hypothetical protein